MKKPIPFKRKKQPEERCSVVVRRFGKDDYEAMAAWDEVWRILLTPKEQQQAA